METISVKVRPAKEAEFKKLVKKFNRCLKAGGFAEIEPTLAGTCKIQIHNSSNGFDYTVEGNEYLLPVPDEVLKMGEYHFIGEYRRIDGKWYRTMHSLEKKDEYDVRESNMRCDHCGRNITNRNGYYFFRKPSGELTVVGSTCVDAFMGFKVRELLEALGDATEFEHGYCEPNLDKEVISVSLDSFVRIVSGETYDFHQWKKSTDDDSTSSRLKTAIGNMFFDFKAPKKMPEVSNIEQVIDEVRQYWRKQIKFDDLTVNSKKALDGDYVPLNWAGIAGWAIYKPMAIANGTLQERVVQANEGGYVGNVGDSLEMDLIPKKCIPFENQWGNAWAIHFDDENGNHFLTFSSGKWFVDFIKSHINTKVNVQFVVAGQCYDRGQRLNKIKQVKALISRS